MNNLSKYIIEKLHISKDTKIEDKFNNSPLEKILKICNFYELLDESDINNFIEKLNSNFLNNIKSDIDCYIYDYSKLPEEFIEYKEYIIQDENKINELSNNIKYKNHQRILPKRLLLNSYYSVIYGNNILKVNINLPQTPAFNLYFCEKDE